MATITPARPEPYPQGDGSAFQWKNCVLACATVLMHRASAGRFRVPADRLRAISGDTQGGVSFTQAAEAVSTATAGQVHFDVLLGITRGELMALIAAGRAGSIDISCAVTVRTSRRTNWFTGSHAITLNQYRFAPKGDCRCERAPTSAHDKEPPPHGEYLVEDPGTTSVGWLWWSADLIYRAAEALRGGAGTIQGMFTRDTEGVARKARVRARIRSAPRRDSAGLGYVPKDKPVHVVATVEGGEWAASGGRKATIWHKLAKGFVRGEALQ